MSRARIVIKAALIVSVAAELAGCKVYDSDAYYKCKWSGQTEDACRQQDDEARKASRLDKTQPRVVDVCVSRSYSLHSSYCSEYEQRCVWGADYAGPKRCDVVYPQLEEAGDE